MSKNDDLPADLPRPLSAKFKCDFAYPTVKDRMPVILTKVIDKIYRMKADIGQEIGEEGFTDLKNIAGELSGLKNHMLTNKPLTDIQSDGIGDEELWNSFLQADRNLQQKEGCQSAWFISPWLLTECYMYRRIMSAILRSKHLSSFDPYGDQKKDAFLQSRPAMLSLLSRLVSVKDNITEAKSLKVFTQFLHVALWGNKCDLSISAGAANHQVDGDPVGQALRMQHDILRDDTEAVWYHLVNGRRTGRVDIILDNAGFELYTDLCLAELLTSTGLASCVRFHGKCLPWFISDVTAVDWEWTLNELVSSCEDYALLSVMGKQCKQRLTDGVWHFTTHPFWTLPHDFADMKTVAPDLYSDLSGSDLIIFKGDLNYRKLVGDRLWPPTTPFSRSLRGFGPAPLCTLRTVKCDVVTGLEPGKAESVAVVASDWMLTGSYAVIQFANSA